MVFGHYSFHDTKEVCFDRSFLLIGLLIGLPRLEWIDLKQGVFKHVERLKVISVPFAKGTLLCEKETFMYLIEEGIHCDEESTKVNSKVVAVHESSWKLL